MCLIDEANYHCYLFFCFWWHCWFLIWTNETIYNRNKHHYSDVTWGSWRLNDLLEKKHCLGKEQRNKQTSVLLTLCVRGIHWTPSQTANNAESLSILWNRYELKKSFTAWYHGYIFAFAGISSSNTLCNSGVTVTWKRYIHVIYVMTSWHFSAVLVRGINHSRANDAELWFFLCCYAQQTKGDWRRHDIHVT